MTLPIQPFQFFRRLALIRRIGIQFDAGGRPARRRGRIGEKLLGHEKVTETDHIEVAHDVTHTRLLARENNLHFPLVSRAATSFFDRERGSKPRYTRKTKPSFMPSCESAIQRNNSPWPNIVSGSSPDTTRR